MLVVSNQQELKVPHGVRTFANQSTIHGETGSMKFNLKIVAATAAVAMMSSGAAQAAASIGVTPLATYTYSKEGLSLSGTTGVTLPDIVVTFGNNLTNNDDIFITLPTVVSLPLTVTPTSIVCSIPGNAVGYVTTVSGGWNFRVTAVGGVSIGDSCTFSGLKVQGASLGSTTGVLTYKANRAVSAQLVDQATSITSIVVKTQFGLSTVDTLNGIVNVYDDRLSFLDAETVAPGAGNFEDTLNFDTTVDGNGTTFTGPTVTTTAVVAKIDGDFGWVDSDGDGSCEAAEFDSAISYADWSADTDSTCTQLVWNGTAGNTTNLGFFEVPGDVILNPVDWLGNVEWSYSLGSASGKTGQAWDPGIWTINGAQVYIQYMPFGTNISRIIYAANKGLINADATADIYYNGAVTQCSLGSVNNLRVTELSAQINACVATAMGADTSGKVAILLTFTAPDKDIEVYSAYNVGGNDRGTVVNTSNGRSFFYGTGFPFVPPAP